MPGNPAELQSEFDRLEQGTEKEPDFPRLEKGMGSGHSSPSQPAGYCRLTGLSWLVRSPVALLSAVPPMAMEFQALQIMSARTYGILVTLEPAVGPIVRAWFLGQAFSGRGLVATGGVTIADIGITVFDKPDSN